jgi:hypothetical protein
VKAEELVAVPAGVVTESVPLFAPFGTVVEIEVEETAVNVALVPPNFTAVAPVNPVPARVTVAPTLPLAGEKPEIEGG